MAELPDREPHVWWIEPSAVDPARRDLRIDEDARMERFCFERDREIYLATRVVVRTTLSLRAMFICANWARTPDGCR